MRIRKPGKVCEKLWLLGRKETCVYLLEGNNESMLISGGLSYAIGDILLQIEEFGIDMDRITKLLILHAHFDHVGIVPFFRRQNRDLEIYASSRAWEILSMPKVIKTINTLGKDVAERVGKKHVLEEYNMEWGDIFEGTSVSDDYIIDLGDLEGIVYETPGHSSCSISLYVPRLKALFPSDGGGIPFRNTILASGNSNYTKYQESLEKLKDLDTDYVCADHYGYVKGEEAKDFIHQSLDTAADFRALLEDIYRRTGDLDSAVKEFLKDFYENNENYFLPPQIMETVHWQMLRHIVKVMEAS